MYRAVCEWIACRECKGRPSSVSKLGTSIPARSTQLGRFVTRPVPLKHGRMLMARSDYGLLSLTLAGILSQEPRRRTHGQPMHINGLTYRKTVASQLFVIPTISERQ